MHVRLGNRLRCTRCASKRSLPAKFAIVSYLRENFEPSPTVDGSCSDPTLPSLMVDSRFRHFPELDGLRGSAVLLVIAGHTLMFRLNAGSNWGQLAALG